MLITNIYIGGGESPTYTIINMQSLRKRILFEINKYKKYLNTFCKLILQNKFNYCFYIECLLKVYPLFDCFSIMFLELWLVDSKCARIVIDIIIKDNGWMTLIKILRNIDWSLDKQIIDEKYKGLYQSIVTRICNQLLHDWINREIINSELPIYFDYKEHVEYQVYEYIPDTYIKFFGMFPNYRTIHYINFTKILFKTLKTKCKIEYRIVKKYYTNLLKYKIVDLHHRYLQSDEAIFKKILEEIANNTLNKTKTSVVQISEQQKYIQNLQTSNKCFVSNLCNLLYFCTRYKNLPIDVLNNIILLY